ncbi:MAG: complex I NDUFA9 subunit family protein, partial [Alphaproteobacteria bacterium]|nr:complex I NDUFA9 subunit family protein [Alphaproteobacteria bacterium]
LGGPNVYSFKELLQAILAVTNRRRLLLPLPSSLASLAGFFLQYLPGKLITPDQVTLLKTDNVVSPDALTLKDLGIDPDSLEAVLPTYLWRFRKKGQFENSSRERVIGRPAT